MNLITIWVSFIIIISLFQELTSLDYFLANIVTFCFTYLYNVVNITTISLKTVILIFSIPSFLFWYVAFVYNDFLSLTPLKFEAFISLLFVYIYITLFILCKYKRLEQRRLK